MEKCVFIVGCGYVGRRVASAWRTESVHVGALTHTECRVDELKVHGIAPIVGDLDSSASLEELPVEDSLLYHLAPPPQMGEIDNRVGNLLSAMVERCPARIVYLSTTGVYGDCGGVWIDEQQPLNPVAARAKRRVDAEQRYREWCEARGVELVILRVSGIYGPGKLPEARIRRGDPVLEEASSPYTNRIHIDDLVAAAVAAGREGASGIYNVADGHPTTMTDYFCRVADHLGLPQPEQLTPEAAEAVLGEGMKSYLAESRRIDNSRLKDLLGGKLRFPDLEHGLAGC
ncbi:hypothetical protein BOW53_07970 [Solemya pervernicosa gill symbiont]|uniref:NAD-dependent epimerase/dehydratase domain-containing protein n=1 Tax=Solemya pervernicosa gill symbiont TaxID=642797 RepID=A0A1T2L5K8_9GAMM|nr:SDR family oxidoreductase [Solemya pervernicosa gill symbiont]OOZ40397.1 hypothetical protein BOW53_07970 [Solemya pervernicosa gill symbiont]